MQCIPSATSHLPQLKFMRTPVLVTYASQLKGCFFFKVFVSGKHHGHFHKKMYLQHWFLVVIGIYLNRFDWINGRKVTLEFLCKNWLWVIFAKTLSSSRIEFKYLQIFGFGFNHFLFSCFTHRWRIFCQEDMIHVHKISDCYPQC